MSSEMLTEAALGRRHVAWQFIQRPLADNWESPVGWWRLSTWPEALPDG